MTASPQDKLLLGVANADGTFTGVTSGTSESFTPQNHDRAAWAIVGNGTITGGALVIEEAFNPKQVYAGTWSVIATVSGADMTALSGNVQKVIHINPTALYQQRVRITSAITGGGAISANLRYQ